MRFLLDQNIERRIATNLREDGHDVRVVGSDERPGLSDIEILRLASKQGRILITKDRDFGELVFRHQEPHAGVIFLRVRARDFGAKWNRLAEVLQSHADELISCRRAERISRCHRPRGSGEADTLTHWAVPRRLVLV